MMPALLVALATLITLALQIHLSRRFSLDGYASVGIDLQTARVRDRYLGGFSWAF
jgi:hypothetical protein